MPEPMKVRILLADDHVLIRHGIRNILSSSPRLEVVGEVANGGELITFLAETAVDMVILDISMPGIDGMEAMALVKGTHPELRILILTMHKNRDYFYNAMAAGADGYLMKDDPDDELLVAIDRVMQGKIYLSPSLGDTDDLLELYRRDGRRQLLELTRREKEVLRLVVQGFTSKKMAEQLNLSQRTIDHHRASLLRKLKRKNSADLANYALRCGFVFTKQ